LIDLKMDKTTCSKGSTRNLDNAKQASQGDAKLHLPTNARRVAALRV
jgi:hypothetical protein